MIAASCSPCGTARPRNTVATFLMAACVYPRIVMETPGHSNVGITLNTYSHVSQALQRTAADHMQALLHPTT